MSAFRSSIAERTLMGSKYIICSKPLKLNIRFILIKFWVFERIHVIRGFSRKLKDISILFWSHHVKFGAKTVLRLTVLGFWGSFELSREQLVLFENVLYSVQKVAFLPGLWKILHVWQALWNCSTHYQNC